MAEDMDLTWTMYSAGEQVRFVPGAVCYPIEPHNFMFMRKQLRRWSHGFMQNVQLHFSRLLSIAFLRSVIGVAFWESTVASIIYLAVVPLTALIWANPLILLVYILDARRHGACSRSGQARRVPKPCAAFRLLRARVVNCVFVGGYLSEMIAGLCWSCTKGH